ncbi:hypothetical protein BaRGS_00006812 [Batillaria attramentaria]|uniref:Uncharacterized protein n=1 Tax=Batillaria attramentaria TaxID=370345 RepID=A0ABD0LR95_9CAEN
MFEERCVCQSDRDRVKYGAPPHGRVGPNSHLTGCSSAEFTPSCPHETARSSRRRARSAGENCRDVNRLEMRVAATRDDHQTA